MKIIGKVIGTFSATVDSNKSMPRPKVETLNMIEGYGIENDKFAKKDLDKTVMILGINSYETAKNNNIELEYGSLGENIVFDFDPHAFAIGTKLEVQDVVLEITEKCTICNHLSIFDKKLPKTVKDCRGLYCKILRSGEIKKDMKVSVKE